MLLIERMAKAAHESLRLPRPGTSDGDVNPVLPPPWEELKPYYRVLAVRGVRAALAEARSGAEAILYPHRFDYADAAWSAIIDAIRAEEPEAEFRTGETIEGFARCRAKNFTAFGSKGT